MYRLTQQENLAAVAIIQPLEGSTGAFLDQIKQNYTKMSKCLQKYKDFTLNTQVRQFIYKEVKFEFKYLLPLNRLFLHCVTFLPQFLY